MSAELYDRFDQINKIDQAIFKAEKECEDTAEMVDWNVVKESAAGAFFGLSHGLNIFFGENPLIQVPSTMLWGMFVASVYMLSDNLLLVMLLHTLNDSTFRIVDGLFGYDRNALMCQAIDVVRDVIDYVVLPVMAVLICIFYDKLKKKTTDEDKN